MYETNINSIREYLRELKQTKSRHPQRLENIISIWTDKLKQQLSRNVQQKSTDYSAEGL